MTKLHQKGKKKKNMCSVVQMILWLGVCGNCCKNNIAQYKPKPIHNTLDVGEGGEANEWIRVTNSTATASRLANS